MSALPSTLRAECSRCAGLCCVAHAFYAVQGFAFDKPAHTACTYLTAQNRCAIHAQRALHGFAACAGFDCYGAGQRVTQELCRGMSWRASPEIAIQIFHTYISCLTLHRLIALLRLAEPSLAPALRAQGRRKQLELDALCSSEGARNGTLDIAGLEREVLTLVREARSPVAQPGGAISSASPSSRSAEP